MTGSLLEIAARTPRSLKCFLVAGALTVAVDAVLYALLLHVGVPVNVAKGLSLVAATLFAYVANRNWVFNESPAQAGRLPHFLALYALAILINVLVNRAGLSLMSPQTVGYIASWFLATASSSTWNYLGLRFFVFPASTPSLAPAPSTGQGS